jgi:hypothetical protein
VRLLLLCDENRVDLHFRGVQLERGWLEQRLVDFLGSLGQGANTAGTGSVLI